MDWFIKAFIRSSLIWFTLGIALGLAMAAHPLWVVYRPAHAHMNVVGFITMMVFGVGYQLLPRLFGGGLWSRRLAIVHLWLANVGLALMVAGFMLAPHIGDGSIPITEGGGAISAAWKSMLCVIGALFTSVKSTVDPWRTRITGPGARPSNVHPSYATFESTARRSFLISKRTFTTGAAVRAGAAASMGGGVFVVPTGASPCEMFAGTLVGAVSACVVGAAACDGAGGGPWLTLHAASASKTAMRLRWDVVIPQLGARPATRPPWGAAWPARRPRSASRWPHIRCGWSIAPRTRT